MIRKILFVLAFLFLARPAFACSGSSPNWTASSWTDIQTCHDGGGFVDGDTITVTSGSYTATTGQFLTFSKYFKLVAGGGSVTITDNTCAGACTGGSTTENLMTITESTAGSTQIGTATCSNLPSACNAPSTSGTQWIQAGFHFVQGTAIHSNPNGVIRINDNSGGKPIIIAGNDYQSGGSGDFIIAVVNRGLIYANSETGFPGGGNCLNNVAFVRHKISSGNSWTTVSHFGTADTNGDLNLYIEANTLINAMEGVDVDDNARTVMRYNWLINSGTITHGVDTSAIGGRSIEFYGNTFIFDQSNQPGCGGGIYPANVNSVFYIRGGTALVHDNVIPSITGGTWGAKSAVSFTVEELRRNGGSYGCWSSVGGSNPGAGYPSPRNAGWGWITGATQAGTTGVFQDLEPIYLWSNTGTGNYDTPSIPDFSLGDGASCQSQGIGSAPYPSSSDYIIANRDFYTSTAKPGYTAYTYPHPLAGGSTPSCTPDHLAFTAQPSSAAVSAVLGTVSVSVEDSGNNVCTSATDTITIANKGGTCTGMTLGGTKSGAASSGLFDTTDLFENAAGACTLSATASGLTGADSDAFTISAIAVGGGGFGLHGR